MKIALESGRVARSIAWASAGIVAAVATAGVLGWIFDAPIMVSYVAASIPLQANTAVCLLLFGVALMAILLERRALAFGLAAIVMTIAGLCAVEIYFAPESGVMRMFLGAPGPRLRPMPLAPNSAIALLLAGTSIFLLDARRMAKAARAITAAVAAGIGAFGAMSLAGYAFGLSSAYRWGEKTPMSLPAAIGLVACGLSIVAAAWDLDAGKPSRLPSWSPVAVLSALATTSVLLFSSLQVDAALTRSWPMSQRRALFVNAVAALVFGFGTSIAFAVALALARKNGLRSRQLEAANAELDSEVSRRRVAQDAAERLNRALSTVSACRQAIAKSQTETELLDRICEIAVSAGGYRLVWIGFTGSDAARSVRPVAKAGTGTEYLQDGFVTWADEPRGRGPTGIAIRTAAPSMCNDTLAEEMFLPWRDRALQFGFRSSLVVPLLRRGKAFGAISIYAPEPQAFGDNEMKLFEQLASDLTFGIDALQGRAARKAAEAATRASEERYRCLTLATAQIVWMTDPNGLVCGDMPIWRSFTGMTFEQIQGWGWIDALHPDDRERTSQVSKAAIEARSDYETEYRIRRSDGEYRHVWVRGVPVLEKSGEIREWVGTCTDITERRASEERLREQAALLELTPAGIFVRDLDSRVVFWSRGAQEMYGWDSKDALGKVTHDLLQTQFPIPVESLSEQVLRNGFWEGELVHAHRDGRRIAVASRWALQRNERGDAAGILEVNVDISERKRAQQELARFAEDLQRSNAELQDFAFVASHDLQEPLRKITAFSDRLRDRCGLQLDDTGRDFLNRMHSAAERMARLIDSLLEYSRLSTRALPFEDVDLAVTCAGVLADLEQRIRETGARVLVRTLPRVMGDPSQLRQLLQNLLSNALKFLAPGSRPEILVQSLERDGRCEISVSDNGIGFDPAYTERIFRPFQRLHGRSEYEGSGMGLAICRKIAQRHGAEIHVESQPGKGSTFTVSLTESAEYRERHEASRLRREAAASDCIPHASSLATRA